MYIVDVLVTNGNFKVDHPFSYLSNVEIALYKRVEILFRNSRNIGLVIACSETNKTAEELHLEKGFSYSFISNVIDDNPLLDEERFLLAKWMAKTTLSPLITCLNTLFPPALKTSLSIQKVKTEEIINLSNTAEITSEKDVLFFQKLKNGMTAKDVRKISAHYFRKFVQKKWISLETREITYANEASEIFEQNFLPLTFPQKQVLEEIQKSKTRIHYLYGVTGSGKTEVYLNLIKKTRENSRQVLLMVPEISLTPQMIARVRSRFGNVAFYHSQLSPQERYEQYQRVLQKKTDIIVGTRSSIFLPFHNLGLVIIDEEHDQSYKQDTTPCYDARRIAMKRIIDSKGKLVLASATPSLDYYTRALKGEYGFSKLPERINLSMPQIEVVNVREDMKRGGNVFLSARLQEEISKRLTLRQQFIPLGSNIGFSLRNTALTKPFSLSEAKLTYSFTSA